MYWYSYFSLNIHTMIFLQIFLLILSSPLTTQSQFSISVSSKALLYDIRGRIVGCPNTQCPFLKLPIRPFFQIMMIRQNVVRRQTCFIFPVTCVNHQLGFFKGFFQPGFVRITVKRVGFMNNYSVCFFPVPGF